MKLAIVGIRGLPNNYGGFETLAEYLVEHLSREMEITVYCSSKDMETRLSHYKGAKLKYIPITSHGAFGIIYDSISLIHALFQNDKILFLGFGAGFVMPFVRFFKSKIILNIGGLDWKRNKWSPTARKVIKKAEALLIKNSGCIISDNIGIKEYIQKEYGCSSTLIAYGGDQAVKRPITEEAVKQYPFLKHEYAFSVIRIQKDNNIDMMLDAFVNQSQLPFVMVGNWNNSPYGIDTKSKYLNKSNLILLDAIYDREILDILRSNCTIYIHGHSAGGTNPSLAEAMYLGLPTFSYASGYNEHTSHDKAIYFNSSQELTNLIKAYKTFDLKKIGEDLQEVAIKNYRWEEISNQYKKIINIK
jgi:glycosyltransferase involved in cell wall biosynthesis